MARRLGCCVSQDVCRVLSCPRSNLDILFRGMSEIDQLFKIFQSLGTPGESVWQGVTSLTNYSSAFPRCVWNAACRGVCFVCFCAKPNEASSVAGGQSCFDTRSQESTGCTAVQIIPDEVRGNRMEGLPKLRVRIVGRCCASVSSHVGFLCMVCCPCLGCCCCCSLAFAKGCFHVVSTCLLYTTRVLCCVVLLLSAVLPLPGSWRRTFGEGCRGWRPRA